MQRHPNPPGPRPPSSPRRGGPGAARTGGRAGIECPRAGLLQTTHSGDGEEAPPGGGRAGKGPSRPNTRNRWPPGGTVCRHGGPPDRRGEVDGPEVGRERPEELGAHDERGLLAWEIIIEAEVEGVGRIVQDQDGAGPAEDVEARVVGGPQGDAALSALVATSGRGQ